MRRENDQLFFCWLESVSQMPNFFGLTGPFLPKNKLRLSQTHNHTLCITLMFLLCILLLYWIVIIMCLSMAITLLVLVVHH